MKENALMILSLFASTGTLLCCALPTLLVTLGVGTVVAGAVSSVPGLVALGRNKEWVFLTAGVLITVNWIIVKRRDHQAACGIGSGSGDTACTVASHFGRIVLWISTGLYAVGFIVAFLAYPVGEALGWL